MQPSNYWELPFRIVSSHVDLSPSLGGSYDLSLNKVLSSSDLVIGIATRSPGMGRKSSRGKNIAKNSVFYSSFLELKSDSATSFIDKIPVEFTQFDINSENKFFRLSPIKIDTSSSKVIIKNEAEITENESFEFYFMVVNSESLNKCFGQGNLYNQCSTCS